MPWHSWSGMAKSTTLAEEARAFALAAQGKNHAGVYQDLNRFTDLVDVSVPLSVCQEAVRGGAAGFSLPLAIPCHPTELHPPVHRCKIA
jgi:hypothetical protein